MERILSRLILFIILACLCLAPTAFAQNQADDGDGESPALQIEGTTPEGQPYTLREVVVSGPEAVEQVKAVLKQTEDIAKETKGAHVETFISSDADTPEELKNQMGEISSTIKTMPTNLHPNFVLLDDGTLGQQAGDLIKGEAKKMISLFRSYTKPGIVMTTLQAGIAWYSWIHFSSGHFTTENKIASIINILMYYVLYPNPEYWYKYTDVSKTVQGKIADAIGMSDFKKTEAFATSVDVGSAFLGRLWSAGIFKTILSWQDLLHGDLGVWHSVGNSVLTATATTLFFSSFDFAVRKWNRLHESPVSVKNMNKIIWLRNIAQAALLPLIYHGNMPSLIIGGTIGTVGTALWLKGDKFIPWFKNRAVFQIFEGFSQKFHRGFLKAERKFFGRKKSQNLNNFCEKMLDKL